MAFNMHTNQPSEGPSVGQIAAAFNQHAPEIALQALGDPNKQMSSATEWRYGRNGSLSVIVQGHKKGRFFDHEQGIGGDLIQFIEHVQGCSKRDAVTYAKQWLGWLEDGAGTQLSIKQPDAAEIEKQQAEYLAAKAKRKTDLKVIAGKIWKEAKPIQSTHGEAYFAARGIDAIHLCADIRYHPSLYRGKEWPAAPAIVCAMRDPKNGKFSGVHRTYLHSTEHRRLYENKGEGPGKLMLGEKGVVMLTPSAEVSHGLGISEGLETGLSILQAGLGPIWAALDAGNIEKFPVLGGIDHLTIWADNDPVNPNTGRRAGQHAASICAVRWSDQNKEVTINTPHTENTDFNSLIDGLAAPDCQNGRTPNEQ